jgi:hypothetical protein
MRLNYTLALVALLGYAGWTLAQAPASPPSPTPNPPPGTAPATNGNPVDPQAMNVDGNGAPTFRGYFGAEYLLWTLREAPLKSFPVSVPVNVTFPEPVDPLAIVTITPSADGVIKGEDLTRNGARLTLGYWCSDCIAAELIYFQLENKPVSTPFAGTGRITLSVPVPGDGVALVPVNATVAGASFEKLEFWGLEALCKERALVVGCFSVDKLCGLRYFNLDESVGTAGVLGLSPITGQLPVGVPPSTPFGVVLGTHNNIYLGEVGLAAQADMGHFAVGGWVKGGLGVNDEDAKFVGNGSATTLDRTQFTWFGEANLNVSWQCSDCLRFHVGYDWLWLKSVVRAGEQITGSGSAASISSGTGAGGVAASAVLQRMKDDKFLVHGIDFGVEFRY